MTRRDPRVTARIEQAPAFARPILTRLRAVVHQACPDVEESIKWGMPTFLHHGILGGMADFKAHCAFWLRRGAALDGILPAKEGAMGQLGRLTSVADLPPRGRLLRVVKAAARLNERAAAARRPPAKSVKGR